MAPAAESSSKSGGVDGIFNRLFPFLNPHQIIAVLCWLYKRNISRSEVEAALATLVKRYPLKNASELIGKGREASVASFQERQKKRQEELSDATRSLATCLITVKGEEMASASAGSGPTRHPLSYYAALWASRAAALEADAKDAAEAAATEEEVAEIEARLAENQECFRPFDLTALRDFRELANSFFATGDYVNSLFRARFYLDCVSGLVSEAAADTETRQQWLWGALITASLLRVAPELGVEETTAPAETATAGGVLAQYFQQLVEEVGSMQGEEALAQTAVLMHLALWLLFKPDGAGEGGPGGRRGGRRATVDGVMWNDLVSFLLTDRAQQACAVLAPHLARYYAAIALVNRRRSEQIRAIAQLIDSVRHKYEDPLVTFVWAMFSDYDLELGQRVLPDLPALCENDFFLNAAKDEIADQSRLVAFDNYCRIHSSISIDMITEKLHMDTEAAEQWIVGLIRETKLDAKIDSERRVIEIVTPTQNPYATILEKTRLMVYRAQSLAQALSQRSSQQSSNKATAAAGAH